MLPSEVKDLEEVLPQYLQHEKMITMAVVTVIKNNPFLNHEARFELNDLEVVDSLRHASPKLSAAVHAFLRRPGRRLRVLLNRNPRHLTEKKES